MESFVEGVAGINEIIEANNSLTAELNSATTRAAEERRALQREACQAFVLEFASRRWNEISEVRRSRVEVTSREKEVEDIERRGPSANARDRVANTFEALMERFFAGKYVFDKTNFSLVRGNHQMTKGAQRTLSDGEKTVIAFCYFFASIHRKVESNSDYGKLFLVFDDPVTSLSYDFVFAIADTLKSLSISRQGDVSIVPVGVDGNLQRRPELLILTHSSYFFNIAVTNAVVKVGAAFILYPDKGTHKISEMRKYIAPFQQQIKHIVEVAGGEEPDHSTGNAIRSVLEAVGRFCRPDKCGSVAEFIQFLAAEEGISLRSVLINSLSHGSFYQETAAPDDLRVACEETLRVVGRYAEGQMKIVSADAGA